MMNGSRDRLIERYLSGRMSPGEKRTFLQRLDTDAELRRMLETERAIERTLRRDRDALPAEDSESRMHVMAMLGTMSTAQQGAITTASTAATSMTGVTATATFKAIVAAVAGTALVAGGIVIVPRIGSRSEKPARPTQTAVSAPAPSTPLAPPVQMIDSPATVAVVPETAAEAAPEAALTPRTAETQKLEERPAATTRRTTRDSAQAPIVNTAPARPDRKAPPVVITRDTMRVEVRIDTDKMP